MSPPSFTGSVADRVARALGEPAVAAVPVWGGYTPAARWRLTLRSGRSSLEAEGGPPPETLLPDRPDVAAWVSGYFASRAGLPPIPDAPQVRTVQRQQLAPALAWVSRALALPSPAP
jgi:hypothetical protein